VLAAPDPWNDDPYAEPDLVLRGLEDGRFEEVPGTVVPVPIASGRAAAFGDVDGDGDVDVLAPTETVARTC